jgi:probable HAF family extracellular repeat protein
MAGTMSTSTGDHAALYSGGVWTDLGGVAGAIETNATGINASGQVVGIAYFPATGKYPHRIPGKTVAFVVRNGAPVDLNTLVTPNSGYTIEAPSGNVCINESGQILCEAKTPVGELHAVLLTPN